MIEDKDPARAAQAEQAAQILRAFFARRKKPIKLEMAKAAIDELYGVLEWDLKTSQSGHRDTTPKLSASCKDGGGYAGIE